jgi:hypothetical protein
MVRVEVRGRIVWFPRAAAERAQRLAAAHASLSSRRRDLALVLEWVLHADRVVALRRSEARELARLAAEHPELEPITTALASARRRAAA